MPAFRYQVIANISDSITDGEFAALFRPLSKLADGFDACLHLIWIRLARLKQTAKKPTAGLKTLGRSILLQWDCDPHGSMMDYQLAEVVEQCMPSSNGETVVTEICERCAKKAQMSLFFLDQYPRLFTALLKTHPHAALDGLLDSGSNLQRRGTGRRRRFESGGLFAALPEKIIIAWCEKKRSSRYALMASAIDAICEADNGDCSWQPLALSLLAKAPKKPKLLAAYFRQFRPMTWSGSRASLMERRLPLFDELLSNPKLHRYYGFIQSERDNFTLDIEHDRSLDRKLSAQSAATFE